MRESEDLKTGSQFNSIWLEWFGLGVSCLIRKINWFFVSMHISLCIYIWIMKSHKFSVLLHIHTHTLTYKRTHPSWALLCHTYSCSITHQATLFWFIWKCRRARCQATRHEMNSNLKSVNISLEWPCTQIIIQCFTEICSEFVLLSTSRCFIQV